MGKQSWKPGNMLYPVPAVLVSCRDKEGKDNVLTVAWAGTICSDPAMLSISVRKERYSHSMIKETGEFVVNLTTKELLRATDYCGVKSGRDEDKFAAMELTKGEAEKVNVPIIMESPVNIECKVKQVLEDVGFTVKEETVENEGVDEGVVVGIDPAAGTTVKEGSTITVYISGEVKEVPVEVPYLVGLSKADAVKEIENRGLKVGSVTSVKSSLTKGTVISQSIAKGEEVAKGTKINLEISTGEEVPTEYSIPVTVEFTTELPNKIINVIAYLNGEEAHTSKQLNVDGLTNNSYTFAVSSTQKTGKLKVCIKDSAGNVYDYVDYSINFEKGKVTLTQTYEVPVEQEPPVSSEEVLE